MTFSQATFGAAKYDNSRIRRCPRRDKECSYKAIFGNRDSMDAGRDDMANNLR
jgi:hypothetical protein